MNQKYIVGLLLIIVIAGLAAAGVNQIASNLDIKPTPSPTSQLIFNKFNKSQEETGNFKVPSPTINEKKHYNNFPGILTSQELKDKKAVINTNRGQIEFEIYPEASKAASNFIHLTQDGFYSGLTFHRVVSGFVIQGGDPLGNGTGGPGYKFEDEPVARKYDKGIVAMANSGPNTNGSQFFIMLEDNPNLPPNYTIFGQVILGQDVVEKIQVGDVMKQVRIDSLVRSGQ